MKDRRGANSIRSSRCFTDLPIDLSISSPRVSALSLNLYAPVIRKLKSLSECTTVYKKFRCLMEASKVIATCIDDHYNKDEVDPDDLNVDADRAISRARSQDGGIAL